MKTLKTIGLYLWQSPQIIIGLVFLLILQFMKRPKLIDKVGSVRVYTSESMSGGISLGNYIFLSVHSSTNTDTINHELGHCKQSRLLGLFYLFIIGIPSIVHAMLHKKGNYYDFYTERWADELMNVKRK